ncbi:MAG: leucine-rich repeat domain-containing protein [Candidatus Poribacteria bacterium]|nr:leucine-rich repeat domain-containing protein [Candidatus Poribacteria bacterium]
MRRTRFWILALFFALTCLSVPTGFAQSGDSEPIVKLIYFLPRGNTPQPDIDTKLDEVLKGSQKFFADEMERHGFGRKTFRFETDRRGNAVVNHVNGRFRDAHYLTEPWVKVWNEIEERFDRSQNIHLVVVELTGESNLCGVGGDRDALGGDLMMRASSCFNILVTSHELGHAFGLEHDFHNNAYTMSSGPYDDELSPCHAEWLNVHRYFNKSRGNFNSNTAVEMSPPATSPPHAIRLRFVITDPDGLHQVQLLMPENHYDPVSRSGTGGFLACKSLTGQRTTIEFATTKLIQGPANRIMLQVMDVHGNFTWHEFPIDVPRLLPRSEVVSIPDANLVAVVKETLELPLKTPITQLDMLKLISLRAPEHQITDLTGLEHAKNLKFLILAGNQIRDVTPLTGLTQLKILELQQNQIKDITPLAGLLHLTDLDLVSNQISDIRPLIGLTQLKFLKLVDNPILDTGSLQSLYESNPDLLSDTAPKIEGPWLWIIVPTDGRPGAETALSWNDWLAAASNGSVTEQQIATEGATAGERLQNSVWTLGRLAPTGGDNIGRMVNTIGLGLGTIDNHVAYGSIVLDSSREQNTWMYAGSDDNHKVWLNGEVVHQKLNWNWTPDYQVSFPVILKKGKNVLLVAVDNAGGAWSGFFGLRGDAVYSIMGDTLPETVIRADPVEAGSKIEGPWLWMIAPTDPRAGARAASSKDWLAAASNGSVTEAQVATNGATAGERVQDNVWTLGKLAPTGGNNVGELMNTIGFGRGYIDNHIAYGSIVLDSPREQNTWMYVGSDDNHKVWLNGELVRERLDWHWAHDYQESFPVTLKQGKNVLLVAIQNEGGPWGGYFGFENDTVYSIIEDAVVSVAAANRPVMYWIDNGALYRLADAEVERIAARANDVAVDTAGRKVYWTAQTEANAGTINRANLDGTNVQVLRSLRSVPFGIAYDNANGKLYLANSQNRIQRINADGTGFEYNFIPNVSAPMSIAVVSGNVYWTDAAGNVRYANTEGIKMVRNIAVGATTIGGIAVGSNKVYWVEQTGTNGGRVRSANFDGSGVEDAFTTRAVPYGIAIDTAAGKIYWSDGVGNIQRRNLDGTGYEEIVSNLMAPGAVAIGGGDDAAAIAAAPARVVAAPDANLLLPNYPNPFNPETWIPYQLAVDTRVRITIYDTQGVVVRRLELGHQSAGYYTSRDRAAYWDGRNGLGESVASGAYFYRLETEKMSQMRKMVILK